MPVVVAERLYDLRDKLHVAKSDVKIARGQLEELEAQNDKMSSAIHESGHAFAERVTRIAAEAKLVDDRHEPVMEPAQGGDASPCSPTLQSSNRRRRLLT